MQPIEHFYDCKCKECWVKRGGKIIDQAHERAKEFLAEPNIKLNRHQRRALKRKTK